MSKTDPLGQFQFSNFLHGKLPQKEYLRKDSAKTNRAALLWMRTVWGDKLLDMVTGLPRTVIDTCITVLHCMDYMYKYYQFSLIINFLKGQLSTLTDEPWILSICLWKKKNQHNRSYDCHLQVIQKLLNFCMKW